MTEPIVRRDHGFTLTELLIVVSLMGLIGVTIAGVFTVIVRSLPPTEARADDARSLLGISTWLPMDVSSTPQVPVDSASPFFDRSPSTTSGCSGPNDGVSLLRLSWVESLGGTTTTYISNYRYVNDASAWKIKRISCIDGGTARILNMTSELPPIDPATWTTENYPVWVTWKTALTDGVEMLVGVEFEVETIDGDRLRLDATSHNPDESLGAIPPVVNDGPVEQPEVPCVAEITSVSPSSVKNMPGNAVVGKLHKDVDVDVAKSGSCGALGLAYVPDSEPPATVMWKLYGDSVRITLESIETERWRDGTHTLELRDGLDGAVLDTATLVIQ